MVSFVVLNNVVSFHACTAVVQQLVNRVGLGLGLGQGHRNWVWVSAKAGVWVGAKVQGKSQSLRSEIWVGEEFGFARVLRALVAWNWRRPLIRALRDVTPSGAPFVACLTERTLL